MRTRSYLLCRIINLGDSTSPDLKFTDVSSYGYMTSDNNYSGSITANTKIDYASDKVELSYHKDGSTLYKCNIKGGDKPWRSNYMHAGFRQIPIANCKDILPLVIFQIRRPEIYRTKKLEQPTPNKKVYICNNDILFTEKQSLFAVIYVRNRNIPLTQVSTKDYYSDILSELNHDIDLCIFICRHNYPVPKPYFDIGLKGWITPYACNSVSFCNQRALFDELTSKLNNNIFDRAFAIFMNILGDGNLFHLTEDRLLILDEIDVFFSNIANPIIYKPYFVRFVFELVGNNPQSFINQSSLEKQKTLKMVWDTILKEGKERKWF